MLEEGKEVQCKWSIIGVEVIGNEVVDRGKSQTLQNLVGQSKKLQLYLSMMGHLRLGRKKSDMI